MSAVVNGRSAEVLDMVLVEAQPVFAEGLMTALNRRWPNALFRRANSLGEGEALVAAQTADVLLVDLEVGGGVEIAELSRLVRAGARVTMFCAPRVEPHWTDAARAAGAHAFVCKTMPADAYAEAISLAFAGSCSFPIEALSSKLAVGSRAVRPLAREFQILDQLVLGRSNKEIARVLGISVATVKLHVQSVLRRTGAGNRVEAVERARRMGILSAN
jgi:DNA-binding NarL/FixJ family response regulator